MKFDIDVATCGSVPIDLSSNTRDTVASRSNIYTETHVFGYCMVETNEQDAMEDDYSIAATYVVDNVV